MRNNKWQLANFELKIGHHVNHLRNTQLRYGQKEFGLVHKTQN